jgi:uncharacterized protein (DUF1501 family)
MSFTRRDVLQRASLVALAPMVPAFLARTARAAVPDKDGRVLVVLQLDGGNDGINTVVPFADEGYARCRRALRLPKEQLVKINDTVGLHPALGDAGKLLEEGRLAILQGVGYPNPSRSHFESLAIWHTARFDPEERGGLGWIGRGLDDDRRPDGGVPDAVFVGGGQLPGALRGRRSIASGLARPEDFVLAPEAKPGPAGLGAEPKDDRLAFVRRSAVDGYATADRMAEVVRSSGADNRYPAADLGKQLALMAGLIKRGMGTRVYYARQPGYDTHAAQLGPHANLLRELSGALKAFLDDLAAARLEERVTVLAFSEFGRTVKENGSAGTDHGTAGPLFLAGRCVQAGLVGTTPKLLDLDPRHGDLRVGLDFRRVYAAVLEDWLGLPAKAALGAEFEKLALFRA